MNTVIDIETASIQLDEMPFLPAFFHEGIGNPPEFKSRFTADVEKREEDIAQKIRAWKEEEQAKLEDRRKSFLENCALSPDFSRVIAGGWGDSCPEGGGESTIMLSPDYNEGQLVEHLLEKMGKTLMDGFRIAGFNLLGFDLPFIYWRAVCLDVDKDLLTRAGFQFHPRFGLGFDPNIFDLMPIAKQRPFRGERSELKYDSLSQVAKALGFPEKEHTGDQFAGMSREQQEEYLMNDLELTRAVSKKLLPFF